MIKGSGKLNKETYESLLKQGISAEDTREGLTTAQMIFEAATANGMNQELIEVLKENDPEHIASTPGRFREHRRLILGDYLEKVQALEAAQAERVNHMKVTGKLPPPPLPAN